MYNYEIGSFYICIIYAVCYLIDTSLPGIGEIVADVCCFWFDFELAHVLNKHIPLKKYIIHIVFKERKMTENSYSNKIVFIFFTSIFQILNIII